MHYLSVEGLEKSFGAKPLFTNLNFHVEEGDKIALIARNGAGKSTLLKMIAGKESPDQGTVWVRKELTVAFLEQDPVVAMDKTILENIFHYDHPVLNAIRNYEAAVESADPQVLAQSISQMDELHAWNFESLVKQILTKLNILQLNQLAGTLSGGQLKRLTLARTLIDVGVDPKQVLLILDEPTNHLDTEMVEWLEQFLKKSSITLLLVTHDRYFLDRVAGEIWELERGGLFIYKGDYANYLEKKASRSESEMASLEKAKNAYRRELEWMRRQPKARTTKSKSRIEGFLNLQERVSQRPEGQNLELQAKVTHLGTKIAEFKRVNKNYGDRIILKGFDYTFKRGERLGLVGKNGVGKTTFTNLLRGIEKPDSGKIVIGDTIVFGHYAQAGFPFPDDLRVIEFVKGLAEQFPLASGGTLSASQFLQLFLFSPDQQYGYISNLSGGEKRRLQLLCMLYRNPNFLILDEPTNDLDLATLSVLEDMLFDFPGCLLIISHDRCFMDRLTDHLLVMEGNGIVRDFPGNFSDYRAWTSQGQVRQVNLSPVSSQLKQGNSRAMDNAPVSSEKRKLTFKEKRELEQLERDILNLNEEKLTLADRLAHGNLTFKEMESASRRWAEVIDELDRKETRWLELGDIP